MKTKPYYLLPFGREEFKLHDYVKKMTYLIYLIISGKKISFLAVLDENVRGQVQISVFEVGWDSVSH